MTRTCVSHPPRSGQLAIWDYSTQSLVKSIEASTVALRAARFIARMSWVVCAGDDMKIRVFNSLTQEKVSRALARESDESCDFHVT